MSNVLQFPSEEAREKHLEAIQDRIADGEDVPQSEIDAAINAPLTEGTPAPDPEAQPAAEPEPAPEPQAQPDEGPAPEPGAEPEPEVPAQPAQSEPEAQPAPAAKAGETEFQDLVIKKDMIPSDSYVDDNGNRRPYFTFRKPEDLVDSTIRAQKHIRYLEKNVIPQAEQAGYEKAKAEYEKRIAELEKVKPAEPPAQPEPAAKPAQPAPSVSKEVASKAVQDALDALRKVDPAAEDYDIVKHNQLLQNVIVAQATASQAEISHVREEQKGITEWRKQQEAEAAERAKREAEAARLSKQTEEEKARVAMYEEACKSVDSFATEGLRTPLENGFKNKTREIEAFHIKLARLHTGKPNVTPQDVAAAEIAYLRKTPEIMEKFNDAGFREPNQYELWQRLDQIDALRMGLFRDPVTKEWRERKGPTGQRVAIDDMQVAAEYYAKLTGDKTVQNRKTNVERTNAIVDKLNSRDTGVLQLDTNRNSAPGDGHTITEAQAIAYLEQVDMDDAVAEAETGNPATLEKVNACRKRLGFDLIDLRPYMASK